MFLSTCTRTGSFFLVCVGAGWVFSRRKFWFSYLGLVWQRIVGTINTSARCVLVMEHVSYDIEDYPVIRTTAIRKPRTLPEAALHRDSQTPTSSSMTSPRCTRPALIISRKRSICVSALDCCIRLRDISRLTAVLNIPRARKDMFELRERDPEAASNRDFYGLRLRPYQPPQ